MTKYDLQEFEEKLRRKLADAQFDRVDWIIALARITLDDVVRQERLMTTKEAAAYLGASLDTVQKLIQRHSVPAHKRGRDWFIRQADLDIARQNRPKPGRHRKVAMAFYIPNTYRLPK